MKNRLLKLFADNRATAGRSFAVKALDDDAAEVFIYDAIVDDELDAEWWGGVAPQSFVKALREITATTIHVRINSPGGSVFAARAIETALREHKARIVVHIDGLAASAATFIAMAGDEIVMSPGALFMIHKAWTIAYGNADDLTASAGLLEKIDGTLAATYAARTGQTVEQCAEWMAAETWFTADEAKAAGFVDSIAEDAPSPSASWNLSAFDKAPAPANKPKPAPEPAPAASLTDPANVFAKCNSAAMLRKLEVAALLP